MHSTKNSLRAIVALSATAAVVVTGLASAAASSTVPNGAKKVTVTGGSTKQHINALMPASGAITGKVVVAGSGKAVNAADVEAFDGKGQLMRSGSTDATGTYHLYGLDTGKYRVCVLGSPGNTSAYKFGLAPACIGTSATPTFSHIPSSATAIPVKRGKASHGTLKMPRAGAISGVTRTSGGKKLKNVGVEALVNGTFAGSADSGNTSSYEIDGLRAGTYKVCFFAESDTATSGTGYLSQCYKNVPYSTKVPAAAKSVKVKSNKNTKGIGSGMHPAGAISGTVKSKAGRAIDGAELVAFRNGSFESSAFTDSHGKYTIRDLAAGNYKVCTIGGAEDKTGRSPAKNVCYKSVTWPGLKPPAAAKSVSVKVGSTHKNINIKEAVATPVFGTITGKLTGPGGNPVQEATVYALSSQRSFTATTASDGTYTLADVLPGKYRVCFDPQFGSPPSGSAPPTGYANACYKSAKWVGEGQAPPSGAAKVTVKANHTTSGINVSVGKGGAVSGTVKLAGGGSAFVQVEVLDGKGDAIRFDEANGAYSVTSLTPGSYYVCFDASSANFDPPNKLGYISQCYKNKDWNQPIAIFGARRAAAAAHRPFVPGRLTARSVIHR